MAKVHATASGGSSGNPGFTQKATGSLSITTSFQNVAVGFNPKRVIIHSGRTSGTCVVNYIDLDLSQHWLTTFHNSNGSYTNYTTRTSPYNIEVYFNHDQGANSGFKIRNSTGDTSWNQRVGYIALA